MFTSEHRERVRERVLNLARSDPRVTAGALTGSTAAGTQDHWSDVDLAFAIAEGNSLEAVLGDWTTALDHDIGVLDHFDLRSGASIYRVFLLSGGLEIDVAVTPAAHFGARGPRFRLLFGTAPEQEAAPLPLAHDLIGLAWHHVLHARVCIERGKPWQAEYWISALRDHTLALACLRLGNEPFYGRGVDRLPASVTAPLAAALVRSLDGPELRRALAVATECFLDELAAHDPDLCARLTPTLREFGALQAGTERGQSPHD